MKKGEKANTRCLWLNTLNYRCFRTGWGCSPAHCSPGGVSTWAAGFDRSLPAALRRPETQDHRRRDGVIQHGNNMHWTTDATYKQKPCNIYAVHDLNLQVWREFRAIFRQQEQMRTFPAYDGTEVKQSQWGRKTAGLALKKEASWTPFIQVRVNQINIFSPNAKEIIK